MKQKARGEKGEEIKSENAGARDNEGARMRKLEVGREERRKRDV